LRNITNENYSQYKTQTTKVREMVRKAKTKVPGEYGDYGIRKAPFYKIRKLLGKGKQIKGTQITAKEEN